MRFETRIHPRKLCAKRIRPFTGAPRHQRARLPPLRTRENAKAGTTNQEPGTDQIERGKDRRTEQLQQEEVEVAPQQALLVKQ